MATSSVALPYAAQLNLASPLCSVDIYPYEGGSYTLTGGQVLRCTTRKMLKDRGGSAEIILAPGGPLPGKEWPSWTQIITLQSLVVIAMQRSNQSNVVFVGIVRSVEEDQDWVTGREVLRNIRIEAMDWGAWLQDFNWSALAFLAVVNGQGLAYGDGLDPQVGLSSSLFGVVNKANPGQIAYQWYTKAMAGASGILADTILPYQNALESWPELTSVFFENYPYGAIWPTSTYFLSQDGTWYDKFAEILESPFYELIVGTAPSGTWATPYSNPETVSATPNLVQTLITQMDGTQGTAWASPGQEFYSKGIPNAVPAQAQIVGRVNPLPDLTISNGTNTTVVGAQGQPAYSYTGAYMAKWMALPITGLTSGAGFYNNRTSLQIEDYYNFFGLTPLAYAAIYGNSNAPGIFMLTYPGAVNIAGIHRYGMKSMMRDTSWLVDNDYSLPQTKPDQYLPNLVASLTTRLASYYTPLPIMQNAIVNIPLNPATFVGTVFQYSPFRGDGPWQFYVEGVVHTWNFGGDSETTLDLSRGLPLGVYQSPQQFQEVMTGNVMVQNGYMVSPIPSYMGPTLQTFTPADVSTQTILGEIAGIYATPGEK